MACETYSEVTAAGSEGQWRAETGSDMTDERAPDVDDTAPQTAIAAACGPVVGRSRCFD